MTKHERFQRLTSTESVRANLGFRSARAALLSGSTGFVDFALRILSTAILARLLLPEHFGVVMMIGSVMPIIEQIKDLGLPTATIQRKEISHEEVTNLFWVNVVVSLVLGLLLCACAPLLSAYYREPELMLPTCVLASNLVWGGLMVQHQALLTRQLKLGQTSAVRLAASLVSTLLAVFLAWRGFGLWALVGREVARTVLLSVGMWICLPWVPGWPYWKTSIRPLLQFGAHLSMANIVGSAASAADRFAVGRVWGASAVAVFRQSYQLLLVPMDQLLSPLYTVAIPALSMLQTDPVRFKRYYLKLLTLVCLATMPASVFVGIYAHEITSLLLGPKWSDCVPVVAILCLSVFIKQTVESSSVILITRRESKRYLAMSLTQNLGFVIAMLIGVNWGIVGVAWADVVLTYILAVPKLRLALMESPISLSAYFRGIGRPVLSSLVMATALLTIQSAVPGLRTSWALILGVACAGPSFFLTWLVLPGGRVELMTMGKELLSAGGRTRRSNILAVG